jgi:hypothetical protein
MNSHQIATAIFNDHRAQPAIEAAAQHFLGGGTWDASTHRLLPTVIAEIKKPIYDGLCGENCSIWESAAQLLDMQLEQMK